MNGTTGSAVCPITIPLPRSRKTVMTVSDKENKKYDCMTCPYPRYKCGHVIFCDVCIRKILDEQREKKQKRQKESLWRYDLYCPKNRNTPTPRVCNLRDRRAISGICVAILPTLAMASTPLVLTPESDGKRMNLSGA